VSNAALEVDLNERVIILYILQAAKSLAVKLYLIYLNDVTLYISLFWISCTPRRLMIKTA